MESLKNVLYRIKKNCGKNFMKKVLIDLNIILDFLNKRNFHEEAANIINMCVEKKLFGFIAAHEITTLSYFLLKEKKIKTRQLILFLLFLICLI
ncbi:PIN domain-containing protein [Treponema denticola]|uniref:PIN domain-containing protein n=1 Tax=Treponema denticola TaxID=158 RepID=UPI003D04FADE